MTTRRLILSALLALTVLPGCASSGASYAEAQARPTQTREQQSGLRRHFDAEARRYYTINPADGCTYWTSGELRGC